MITVIRFNVLVNSELMYVYVNSRLTTRSWPGLRSIQSSNMNEARMCREECIDMMIKRSGRFESAIDQRQRSRERRKLDAFAGSDSVEPYDREIPSHSH